MAIYLADPDTGKAAGDAIWFGVCAENITLEEQFEEERVERHGRPYASRHHIDEKHSISIEKWHVVREEDGELLEPHLERFQQYVLVMTWFSEKLRYWIKRIYFGVTASSQSLGTGDAMTDTKQLAAERVVPVTGLNSEPDLTAALTGMVLWIAAGVATTAYTYDFETETWASTGNVSTGVMGIDEGAASPPAAADWYVQIGGEVVLWIEDETVKVPELRAVGTPTLSPDAEADRVEFRFGNQVYAALDADGQVAVRNLIERDTEVTDSIDFVMRPAPGQWAGSLRRSGLWVRELVETAAA